MRWFYALLLVLVVVTGCSLEGCGGGGRSAASTSPEVAGLYGFSRGLPAFQGKTEAQIADQLVAMKVNAVWGAETDAALVTALHARGIKVYATVAMFYGWGANDVDRPITDQGVPLETYAPGHWYQGACPNNEARIAQRLESIRDIAAHTEADGIWLDAIRYPIYWETPAPKLDSCCFCDRCLTLFQGQTGISLPSTLNTAKHKATWILANHQAEWVAWKQQRITDIVRRCNEAIDETRPGMTFGIFSVPWRHSDYNNAIDNIISQDYPALAQYVDVFSPMVYHRMCGQGDDTSWIHDITTYVGQETKKPVWPIIQSLNEPDCAWNPYLVTTDEFAAAMKQGLTAPSQGVIVLTAGDLFTYHYEDAFTQAVKAAGM